MSRNWAEIAKRFNEKYTERKPEGRGLRSRSYEPKPVDLSCRLPSSDGSELTPLEKKIIQAMKQPLPMCPRDSSFLRMDFDTDKSELLEIVKRRLSHRVQAFSNHKERRRVQPLRILDLNCENTANSDNKENQGNASFLLSLLKNRNRKSDNSHRPFKRKSPENIPVISTSPDKAIFKLKRSLKGKPTDRSKDTAESNSKEIH